MRRWDFAGAGVPEEHDGFGPVDELAVVEHPDDRRGDGGVGGGVELVEGFDPWEAGFLHAAGAAAFVADVELDGEGFGEERRVGQLPARGGLAEVLEAGSETGQVQLATGVGGGLHIGGVVVAVIRGSCSAESRRR